VNEENIDQVYKGLQFFLINSILRMSNKYSNLYYGLTNYVMTKNTHAVIAFDFDNTITENTVKNNITGHYEYLMGTSARCNLLHKLFAYLKQRQVKLIIVSLNHSEVIEEQLKKNDFLKYFSEIYDRNTIGLKSIKTKQKFMQLYMNMFEIMSKNCLIVDDQEDNLRNAPCMVRHINHQTGITQNDAINIMCCFKNTYARWYGL